MEIENEGEKSELTLCECKKSGVKDKEIKKNRLNPFKFGFHDFVLEHCKSRHLSVNS